MINKKQRSTVTCGYLECVTDIKREDAFKDELGTFWCNKDKVRGLLVNYGVQHKFPLVYFGKYARGGDVQSWKIAAMMGNEEMIETAVSELGLEAC
jgi:hypothetical protein